ncbi:hypothetical protein K9N68_10395 [Kovacikia minuta CCNUW1]|nr:hypothetical protein [Kovacikia minuta]UBF28247.1 hypothetical protein K9N68_10395 [Kovacikia minuta CCNUW1]
MPSEAAPAILWRNRSSNQSVIWQMNHAVLITAVSLPTLPGGNWNVVNIA